MASNVVAGGGKLTNQAIDDNRDDINGQ